MREAEANLELKTLGRSPPRSIVPPTPGNVNHPLDFNLWRWTVGIRDDAGGREEMSGRQ